jgi:hypothetical protein
MPNNNSSTHRSSSTNGGRQFGKHQGKQSTISARPTRGKHNSPLVSSHFKKNTSTSTLPTKKDTTPSPGKKPRSPTSSVTSTEKDQKKKDCCDTPTRDQCQDNTISPDKSEVSIKPPPHITNKSDSHTETFTPTSYKDITSSQEASGLSDLERVPDWDAESDPIQQSSTATLTILPGKKKLSSSILKSKTGSKEDNALSLTDSSASTVSTKSGNEYESSDTEDLIKNLPKTKQTLPQNKTSPRTERTGKDLFTDSDSDDDTTMAS